jgi:hypothetical protein
MLSHYQSINLTLAVFSLLASINTAIATTQTIGDGQFDLSDWAHEVRYDIGFSSVGESVTQSPSNGNPGAYRETSYSMTHSGIQLYGSIYLISRNLDFTFNPSAQGPITSLDYSEDNTRTFAGWSPALVSGYGVVFQEGKTYLSTGFVFGPIDNNWQTKEIKALTATDFIELVGMTIDSNSHPDFSVTGSTLEFGYARSNSYSFSSSIGHGIDNWFYDINYSPIPEPYAIYSASLILGLVLYSRRSRGVS